jgi:hypothetical protein
MEWSGDGSSSNGVLNRLRWLIKMSASTGVGFAKVSGCLKSSSKAA